MSETIRNENIDKTVNLKLTIEYNGKNYYGWQKQINVKDVSDRPTIQQTIEESLEVLFRGNGIKLIGSGRTDAGVHALNQVANFKVKKDAFDSIGKQRLSKSLNGILPDDISIKKVSICKNDFHSRFSAKKRVYVYYFSLEKSALYYNFVYRIKTKFDINLAKDFCKLLVGDHSFRAFCRNKSDKHDFKAIVYYARIIKQRGGFIKFEICANRFLHSMIRALVAMMLRVASKNITLEQFKTKFYKGVPIKIQYVPSKALFLKKIIY